VIVAQLQAVQNQVNGLDKRITQAHRANADSKRLEAVPGFTQTCNIDSKSISTRFNSCAFARQQRVLHHIRG